jgi:hypothetical protein
MLRQPRFATIYLNAGRWHNADVPVASAETKPQGQTLRELAVYFSLAYGISLVLWLPFLLEKNPPPAFLWLGTFGPTFAALVTHLPLILGHIYNVSWWQFTMLTIAASVFLSLTFNRSGNSVLSAIFVHGIYNVGTGVILNDLIGKATLYNNTIQHNVLWLAYGGVAVLLCVVTKGRLGRGMRLSNSPKVARGAQ